MSFNDRTQAAELLAQKLSQYRGKHPLVLGIPRGAVPMSRVIADYLEGDLDVVLVHKIGAPENPEFALGSVSEFGTIHLSEAIRLYEISSEYVDTAARNEIGRLKERRQSYSPVHPPRSPKDRVVIIVDDGIATGSTMFAAIRAIRSQGAQKIIVAAPVASPRVMEALEYEADEVVVLETPEYFFSISQFYEEFTQVSDEEVLQILSEVREKKAPPPPVSSRKKAA